MRGLARRLIGRDAGILRMRTRPWAMIDHQHRQHSEDRDAERNPDRAHTLMLRLIEDHSNTSPDVFPSTSMMSSDDGSAVPARSVLRWKCIRGRRTIRYLLAEQASDQLHHAARGAATLV